MLSTIAFIYYNNINIIVTQRVNEDPLKKIIKTAQIYLSVIDTVVLDIRRSHILTDALREARKSKFDPGKIVKVNIDLKIYYNQNFNLFKKCVYSRSSLLVRVRLIMEVQDVNSFVS